MKTILLTAIFFLISFELSARIIYIQPVQNAKYVSVNNNIIIGFDETILSSNIGSLISVRGTISGHHSGEIILTDNFKKLIFKPHHSFAFNEKVEVKLNNLKTSFKANNKLSYVFQTQEVKLEVDYKKYLLDESAESNKSILHSDNYATLPNLSVTVSNNPSPGNLFITCNQSMPYQSYYMESDNAGNISYNQEHTVQIIDVKRQSNGLITYHKGTKHYAENNQHVIVDSFACGNGYTTDVHELVVLNNGHALMLSYDPEPVDMSQIVPGGDSNAIVTGLILQEIDENKNVVFQWRSWDHYNIVDAIYVNLLGPTPDVVHGNAIEYDNDGNFLLSARHLNEISKIDRSTGEFIWRLGGVNNEFTLVNDSVFFHYQHHIRRIDNGNITLFDNGNFRDSLYSRAVEYHLDEQNKIATLVWQYRNSPEIYGPNRGSVQRLKNGNSLICWGGAPTPTLTEVTPSGDIALEMSLPLGQNSYRVFRDEVNLTLNAKMAIEGFYNTVSDRLNLRDTVRAYIRSSSLPFSIVDSSKSVIDSLNFYGNFRFYSVPSGTYYISTKHRNGLETWSKAGGESISSGDVYQYDFTSANSNAYGNNVVLKGSKYCIYSGDVNHDNNINLNDVIAISNDASGYAAGYIDTDVNGDYVTDLTDELITYNNAVNFVSIIQP
ncbi:MAG TPA: aryl-sulfate sulfotransferase [Ignavibacteria bacterium]|nr:aryl-sulfate sulfotransferase [Ignavibacteria bacterium]HMR41482.1 aryl-sulfate sulfotransferase [Ignavibacteria bacterium]